MGCGRSNEKKNMVYPSESACCHPSESVAHLVEKVAALRRIINNDGSRRALMKFLQKRNQEMYYYFEVEELLSAKSDEVFELARQLCLRYRPRNLNVEASRKEMVDNFEKISATLSSESTNNILESEEVMKLQVQRVLDIFKNSQWNILSILALALDSFLASAEHQEWERLQRQQELLHLMKRNEESGILTNLGSTRPDLFHNVLVVDDSKIATKIAAMVLTKSGHCVTVANHGRLALEILESNRFNVVLVDLFMPIMDGFETITRIRQLQSIHQSPTYNGRLKVSAEVALPVVSSGVSSLRYSVKDIEPVEMIIIGMSADYSPETVSRAVECGVDYFIAKPFSLSKFATLLDSILSRTDRES